MNDLSMVKDFYNYKGLINAWRDDYENVNENSFLHSVQSRYRNGKDEILVKNQNKYLINDIRHEKNGKILYRNVLEGTGLPPIDPKNKSKDFWLSRDQMISYCIHSAEERLGCEHEILHHLDNHWNTYNNDTGKTDFRRYHMPYDVEFIEMVCNRREYSNWFYLKGLHTFSFGGNEGTSGELLMYAQMKFLVSKEYPESKKWFDRYTCMLEKRFGENPWDKAFAVYFEEGHPNRND